ncbi:MAG: DNA ligase D [Elusimicrobia bacterium]|nr:DNA ligase D [Elusimicrobiota bacterium]
MGPRALSAYRRKRDFARTPEPRGRRGPRRGRLSFFIQRHAARRLHYDFRLEWGGVLKSWAVPKGPSRDPSRRRLAVHVEDHPIGYGTFEGEIPKGQYGAGTVQLWDLGRWLPEGDPEEGFRLGRLHFRLEGRKLRGRWTLARMNGRGDGGKENWLLIKSRDEAARPDGLEPQLATLAAEVPQGDEWVHELKLDGYRVLARVEGGRARLFTRRGLDWTERFSALAAALGGLSARTASLDGEVVALDEKGRTSFSSLQRALSEGAGDRLRYFAFDLLELDGADLRERPLLERKAALSRLLNSGSARVSYSQHLEGKGRALFRHACRLALEGLVSKRKDAPYRPGRGRDWLKIKCHSDQELVIAGFTEPTGARSGLGALVLGVNDGGGLRHAGRVGTGFDAGTLRDLRRRLEALETGKSPFAEPPGGRGVHWVRPKLVAQVAFRGWTAEGLVRQASFKGLREDKPAAEVTREGAAPRVSNPGRVLFPESGLTKGELFAWYELAAPRMLPHLARRPLMLLRCPSGRGRCFYQKHAEGAFPEAVREVDIREKDGSSGRYFYVDDAAGLLALAQLGTIELHPWGALASDVERPERLIIDLDPAPGLPWPAMVRAAGEVRRGLEVLGLRSFLKTTGGKGLHIVAPLVPGATWPEVKRFASSFAAGLARAKPESYTDKPAKSARRGRIFVDYLRNERGATAVAPYSVRALSGAPVSMPISWGELTPSLRSDHFHLRDAASRLKGTDPWAGFERGRRLLPRTSGSGRSS